MNFLFTSEVLLLERRSIRLRAWLDVYRAKPGEFIRRDFFKAFRRLLDDVSIANGLWPSQMRPWLHDVGPKTIDEGRQYFVWPELFGTEWFKSIGGRTHYGGIAGTKRLSVLDPRVLTFVELVLQRAAFEKVPLYVDRLLEAPDASVGAWVRGETAGTSVDSPYCYGRAVQFGHAGLVAWPFWSLEWLNALALGVAADLGLTIGYGPQVPGEFVFADDDGVFCPCDGNFLRPLDLAAERDRMWLEYSRGRFELWQPVELPDDV